MSHVGALGRAAFADQTFLFGPDAAATRLKQEILDRGWQRVLVIGTPSAASTGVLGSVLGALSDTTVVMIHTDLREHSPMVETERLAESVSHQTIDAVVSIGGGKAVDTAKAFVVLKAEGGRLADHCGRFVPPSGFVHPDLPHQKLPIVAVPTTLSGAEVTPGAGCTDELGRKRIIWDRKMASRLIAYDPAVLSATPFDILATTGMNAIAHCAEALYSKTANPISTGLAQEGARLLASGLVGITSSGDDVSQPFSDIGAGAAMAALALCNARSGLHHAICHVLGGSFGLSHGVANSIMLPHVLRFNEPKTVHEQDVFLKAIGPALAGSYSKAAEAVEEVQARLGVPTRLRDAGIAAKSLDQIALETMEDPARFFNPIDINDPTEIKGVLEAAW